MTTYSKEKKIFCQKFIRKRLFDTHFEVLFFIIKKDGFLEIEVGVI